MPLSIPFYIPLKFKPRNYSLYPSPSMQTFLFHISLNLDIGACMITCLTITYIVNYHELKPSSPPFLASSFYVFFIYIMNSPSYSRSL